MASEEKTEISAPAPAAAPSGVNKLVVLLTAVNIIATLAMMAVLFISFQRDKNRSSVEDFAVHSGVSSENSEKGSGDAKGEGKDGKDGSKKNTEYGKMVTLEQFTINLSTPGSVTPKFVRVNISLEVPNDDTENEVTLKMPQVRNAIIDLFNSKRPSDLATAEGRDYLKEEIRNALNGFMVSGKVKGVFFTNFAVAG